VTRPAAFVISLDFELYWGVRDNRSLESDASRLLGVRTVVPRLLELFSAYGVRATWATVGFVFFGSRRELLERLPEPRPRYDDPRLSPYHDLDTLGADEASDPFHYGGSLVRMIAEHPEQEIGTHTFSHYYSLEPGQGAEAFEADLLAARRTASEAGVELSTIVFPRNQVNLDYLSICGRHGITAYRGTERSFIYRSRPGAGDRRLFRALRMADAYVPVAGSTAFHPTPSPPELPLNVPSSRFLRPYDPRLKHLDWVRLRRIVADMSRAAREGAVYHLWWHPENFGGHTEENLQFLTRILDHFARLRTSDGMQGMCVRDLAQALEAQG
jgi:peptidoglycan/xylan/chitin deacetylase (PgdA/CDA1 family)